MKEIPELDAWRLLAGELAYEGYSLFQFQYDADGPTGFCARFWRPSGPDIEIMTRNRAVERAIIAFNSK